MLGGAMKMFYLAAIGLIGLTALGCASGPSPTAPPLPGPLPPPPIAAPVPSIYPQISVGQIVIGALRYDVASYSYPSDTYELTAPRDGTLRVTVSYDIVDFVDLRLGSKYFGSEPRHPRLGEITVVAGEEYLVTIVDGAPWDSKGLSVPYTFKSPID